MIYVNETFLIIIIQNRIIIHKIIMIYVNFQEEKSEIALSFPLQLWCMQSYRSIVYLNRTHVLNSKLILEVIYNPKYQIIKLFSWNIKLIINN